MKTQRLSGLVLFLSFIPLCFSGCKDKGGGKVDKNAPMINRIEIFPANPGPGDVLTAHVGYKTLDENKENVTLEFKWFINGKEVLMSGVNEYSRGNFNSGDTIYVEARARDSHGIGNWTASKQIKVVEKSGSIAGVEIEPAEAFRNTPLNATVNFGLSDPQFTDLYYRWYINGLELDGEEESVLNPGRYRQGDDVVVRVSPDGDFESPTARMSLPVRILNRSPRLISGPHFEIGEGEIIFWIEVEDPDEDELKYDLLSGPPGAWLDPSSGEGYWPVTENMPSQATISIEVQDGAGGWLKKDGKFSLTLNKKTLQQEEPEEAPEEETELEEEAPPSEFVPLEEIVAPEEETAPEEEAPPSEFVPLEEL